MAADKPLYYLSIREAQQLIQSRQLSPVELARSVLERIAAVDGKLHAYIHLMADSAMEEARVAEAEIVGGNWRGPMHGIPVAVKDQLDVEGAAARIRQFTKGVGDATAVRRLREAGAIMLGKLHMSSLPDADLPVPRNPWNTEHVTGGSSTGSGAAVSGGLCLGSLGEDTAGSIRNPSAFCGIAGLKATYGRVSRYGLAPLSWSLDHCGPMARMVEDTAHMLQAIAGHDPQDPTSSTAPVADYASALREDVKGMVVGVPRDYINECAPRTESIVLKLMDKAIDELKSLGARVEEVKVRTLPLATIANAVIYYNEFWAAHKSDAAWVLKNGAAQRRARIYLGILTNSADYIQAQRVRSRVRAEFAEVFRKVDCLALPCQTGPAPLLKDMGPIDTLFKHVVPEYHGPFNLVGLPTLSVPCGFSENNLPIALQLVGKPFDELTILRAGYTYQQHMRWFERKPPI
ncbi:MAG: Asp-tRNA(Asn)/Glu-tRNA(Gln) amidotransferase GatCAB subunit A [Deltaproteobacteria bacterium]|nr:Asp-tRNA(Asn)/Glu-tRNA(Gln) amidotransferase GatCAB subunit A [Deltaproteobacteria bacterium]